MAAEARKTVKAKEEGLSFRRPVNLSPIRWDDAVWIQDIAQGHNAFQLVHIRTAHYRQDFHLICSHALECQVQPLVGVDVWKHKRTHELAKLLISSFRHFSLQHRNVDNADYSTSISHQPGSKLIGADTL